MDQQVGEEVENLDPVLEPAAIELQAFLCTGSLLVIEFASLVTLI
jgi:hypothetical protein